MTKRSGMGPGEDEERVLQRLDDLLKGERVRAVLDGVIERIEQRLRGDPAAVMAWEPVPLEVYSKPLPGLVRSSWVFILKANVATGSERHPNSRQRLMSYRGWGDLQTRTGEHWDSNTLVSDPEVPLERRWVSIPEHTWHQAVTPETNWVVVSFHTVPPGELIEERPVTGEPDSFRRKHYLEMTRESH